MTITEQDILALDVDGGVEEIVLALLTEIDDLKARPVGGQRNPTRYIIEYDGGPGVPGGSQDIFVLVLVPVP